MQPHYIGLGFAGLLLLGLGGPVRAQSIEVPPQLEIVSDGEAEARLKFLDERLEAGKLNAQLWQYGWTGVFGTSALVSAAQAVTADNGDDRVYGIVGAVKSAGGFAQMILDPLPARLGAEPIRAAPNGSRQGRLQKLAVGENLLITNAARAETRFSWRRHLEGVTTNLIGGAVIWAFGDSKDALVSTLSGIAVGEAQIWTQPWRATDDLNGYRAAFPTTTASRGIQWQFRPMIGGAELAFRF